ncbi:MAG: imidazolonepropionase [Myxococcota bacterium]
MGFAGGERRVLIRGARVLTMGGPARRGEATGELGVLDGADVLLEGGRVLALGQGLAKEAPEVVQAEGRVLLPAFVDAHTHACWAGSRLAEWERKLAGASYLELMAEGGGIMATVRATRAASVAELRTLLEGRLAAMHALGTGAAEVKSGYGLDTEAELRMLEAIASARHPAPLRMTACIGHAKDATVPEFVERTIERTLPAVSAAFPQATVDAYCEEGAWSLEETQRLTAAARAAGHEVRLHVDQFHDLGAVDALLPLGVRSFDHLEASTPATLRRLAESEAFGVMLPSSGFHLDDRYADGRAFLDAGGRLALGTNLNPGSAPGPSMPFVLALAVRKLGLSPAEAIYAATRQAAELLDLPDRGRIEVGASADLLLLSARDERELAWAFGAPLLQRRFA